MYILYSSKRTVVYLEMDLVSVEQYTFVYPFSSYVLVLGFCINSLTQRSGSVIYKTNQVRM